MIDFLLFFDIAKVQKKMKFQSVLKVYLMTKNGQNMAKMEKIRKMQMSDNKDDKFFCFPMISVACTGSGYKIEEAVTAGLQPFFFSNFHPEFCRLGPRIALTRTGPFTEYPLSDTKKNRILRKHGPENSIYCFYIPVVNSSHPQSRLRYRPIPDPDWS